MPPNRRSVNTVFQDYALFPHLNVRDNVAYGPMVKGVARAERHAAGRGDAGARPARRLSATASRRSSPAASGSAWRSPARWSTARASCSSTSRSARSTSSCARRCRTSSRRCRPGSASPSSSSPTTRARRCRWPTASRSSTTGRIAQVGTPAGDLRPAADPLRRRLRRLLQRPAARARRPLRRRRGWASLRPEAIAPGRPRRARCTGSVTATRYLGAGTRVAVDVGGRELTLSPPPARRSPRPAAASASPGRRTRCT